MSLDNLDSNIEPMKDITVETVNEMNRQITKDVIYSLGHNIKLLDKDPDNNLELYCYSSCDDNESEIIKNCRGIIFNEDKLILQGFPYISEYNTEYIDKIKMNDIEEYSFYEAYEGTLLRVFYYNKWYISTHRKLDAFKSKWSCKDSFGVLFVKSIERIYGENTFNKFLDRLDKGKQYMFLLRNNEENRIVCNGDMKGKVYHVGTFVNNELTFDEKIGIESPRKLEFKTKEEIKNYIKSQEYKEVPGIMCFGKTRTHPLEQFKILHPQYLEYFKVRGNEPSIRFRYLQVRMNKFYNKKLQELYPEYINIFNEYENYILEIARVIYNAYINRFIKKLYVIVPKEQFHIIKECHSWHLKNRETNHISLERVIMSINQQNPTHLNQLIKKYKIEKNKNSTVDTKMRSESFLSPQLEPIKNENNMNDNPPPSPLVLPTNTKIQQTSFKDVLINSLNKLQL